MPNGHTVTLRAGSHTETLRLDEPMPMPQIAPGAVAAAAGGVGGNTVRNSVEFCRRLQQERKGLRCPSPSPKP